MATSFDMGLLGDLFGGGGDTGLEGYLTPAQQQAMQRQGLLQAAMAIGQASGPSTTPRSLMQILSSGVAAGQQGYADAQKNAITQLLTKQKLDEYKMAQEQRRRLEEIFGAQAPTAGMPMTPQQALAVPGGQVGPTVERAAMVGQVPEAAAVSPEDMRYDQYMKAAQLYAATDPAKSKAYMDQALLIKPREEVTGQPFEVTGADGKPVMVQQFKGGKIKTLEGFGPKREVTLQNVDGRIVAIDKNALKGGETFGTGITPAEQKRLEMDAARLGMDADRLKMERQRLGMEARRLNISEAEFKRGQYERVETADGLVYVPKVPGLPIIPITGPGGEPLTGKSSFTEDQGKSAGFALRMDESKKLFNAPVLDPMTQQPLVVDGKVVTLEDAFGKPNRYQSIMRSIPSAGLTTGIANLSESAGRQQYRQAQENWVTANLRAESGAVIGTDEMEKEIKKYFPQVDDKPQVIEQKAKARRSAELAMEVRGGPALKTIKKAQQQGQTAGGGGRLVTDPATGVTRYVEGGQ
jgi:hypothetical protein